MLLFLHVNILYIFALFSTFNVSLLLYNPNKYFIFNIKKGWIYGIIIPIFKALYVNIIIFYNVKIYIFSLYRYIQ